MRFKDSFHPYACVTILFWSLSYVLTRLALPLLSAPSLGFLRYAAATVSLLAFALWAKMKKPERTDWKWFLLSGFFGFFLYMIVFNKGCETVSASTSSVVIAIVPVLTALLARFLYRERLGPVRWAAIGLEFAGVAVLTLMRQAISLGYGLFWLLLAACALAVYNLLQRRLTKTYTGLQASAYSIFAGTAMLAVFLPRSVREAVAAPPVALLYVAILGVFCSAVAFVAWAEAFKRAERTSSVSNYMFVTPFLTTLLGFLLVGERPDPPTLAGGAIILAGMLLFNFGERLWTKALPTGRPM